MKTTFDPAITGGSNERGVDHSSHLFTFSSEATPSPQLVSLLFHSEKVEGKRGRGACKKKKERSREGVFVINDANASFMMKTKEGG